MVIRLIFCGEILNKTLKIPTPGNPTNIRTIIISLTPE
jgi:hypothetical protein